MTKNYVIALVRAFADDNLVEAGAIVSGHLTMRTAQDAAKKYDGKKNGSGHKPLFAGIESEIDLVKGQCYSELVEKYHAEQFDARAMRTMKSVLEPAWRGGLPETDETIGWQLEDLGIPLDMLRIRYEDRARAELEAAAVNKIDRAEKSARVRAITSELAKQRSEITYTFPAVRGMQAGQACYVAQVPYVALVKLFVFNDEDVVPAQHRAQRVLSERRAADIAQYIKENPFSYVLPALTASVSAEMAFEPVAVAGTADRLGLLHIPVEATMLINDGQHRRRGIELALAKRPHLRDETVAVAIFF